MIEIVDRVAGVVVEAEFVLAWLVVEIFVGLYALLDLGSYACLLS